MKHRVNIPVDAAMRHRISRYTDDLQKLLEASLTHAVNNLKEGKSLGPDPCFRTTRVGSIRISASVQTLAKLRELMHFVGSENQTEVIRQAMSDYLTYRFRHTTNL